MITSDDIYYINPLCADRISKLYLDTDTADVHFVFCENNKRTRISAHKNLLASGSYVFKSMFYGELKAKYDITIHDASMSAFKEFLQFFYCNKVKLTMENVTDVLNLAKKYTVVGCQEVCGTYLKDKVSNDYVCHVYGLAEIHDLRSLKELCTATIDANTKEVLKSPSFMNCDRSVLRHILKSEDLSCSEVEVFEACIAWLKTKTKQEEITKATIRSHFGDLFYAICFGRMTFKEFASLIPTYGHLFTSYEYQVILQMIDSQHTKSTRYTH